jgi:hypothetical protein
MSDDQVGSPGDLRELVVDPFQIWYAEEPHDVSQADESSQAGIKDLRVKLELVKAETRADGFEGESLRAEELFRRRGEAEDDLVTSIPQEFRHGHHRKEVSPRSECGEDDSGHVCPREPASRRRQL